MEDENEASVLDTSQKLARITIEDKKVPFNDVTNTPNKVKVEKKVPNSAESEIDNSPSEDDQVKYNKLITKAKKYTGEGMIKKALELNQKALKICFSEKLSKKVTKMETYLKEYGEEESDEDDNGIINVGNGFHLFKDLYDKLYRHQKEGVLWMWSLFKKKKGGILGDDMGLGKTIQVISFLSGMFDMEKVHYVLIVMPVALVVNWENEFNKWAPGINVTAFHGSSKRERERSLAKVQRRGGVLITTYGMVVTSWEQLGDKDGRQFTWDYMILDEGHKIKNPTKTTKGVYNIPARNRLILTGTPVQNNLRELWALFDFAHHGTLLGTARTFKMEFDTPITRSREKDAGFNEKKLGEEMSEALKKIIAPFFLRRTKAEVQAKKSERLHGDEKEQRKSIQMPNLTRKNELVIWLYLTPTQQKIYQDFIELDEIKELLMTTRSPLVALTVLKKICDHPRLLSTAACAQLGLDGHDQLDEEMLGSLEALESAATKIQHVKDEILIGESGKLMVLVELLDNLKSEGHRCLVFSQSRKMLDIIQKLVTNRGHKIVRLDGTISQTADREERIQKFQTDDSYSIFLLTTQVGGVGLTLTAADRVVIYDPSWNPATDAQAVDRVFRIGQDKNVVIYRLITCGTVEEKIYRRQIFKDSITRQTTGNSKNPYRYFTRQDLKELFKLGDPRSSTTQIQLQDMHTTDRRSDVQLDAHIAFLHTLEMFGISDHDLMFSQEVPHEEEHEDSNHHSNMSADVQADYIQNRIQRAQQLIEMESSAPPDMNDRFEKKLITTQSGERPMPVWKPKPPPSFTQQDDKPRIPDKRTIDLTVVTSPVQSTSPSSPIQIDDDDDEVVQDIKPAVMETKSVKTEIKDEVDDEDVPLDFGLDDLKDEPVSDYLENRVKSEAVDLASNKTSDESVNSVTNQSLDSGSDLEIFENVSSEQNSKQSVPVEDGTSCDSNKNLSSTSEKESENSNMESEKVQNNQIPNEIASPFKIPDSPFVKKTPKQKHRIIEEELIISPDAGSPILSLRKANIPVHLRLSGSSKKLNMSLAAQSPDSPLAKPNSPSSSDCLVENSPDCSFDTVKPLKKDSISPKVNRDRPVCNIMDFKSPEQEAAEETIVEDSMYDESEEELSDSSESPVASKRTSNQRKNAIESSDEEDMIATKTKGRKQRIVDTEDEDEDSEENESDASENESEADLNESEASQNKREVHQNEGEHRQIERESRKNEGKADLNKSEVNQIENEATEDEMEANESEDSDTNEDEAEDLGSEDEFVEDEDGMDNEDVVDADDVSDGGDGVELDEDDDDDDGDYGGSFIDDGNDHSEEGSEEEDSEEEEDQGDGFDDLPENLKLKFNECVNSCRVQYKAKNYEEALAYILQGLEIFPDPELQQQAIKIHKKINK